MSNQNPWRSTANTLSGFIYIPGILVALLYYQGQFFLTILLLTIALANFIKVLGLLNLAKTYRTLKGSVWVACVGLLLLPWGMGGFKWIIIAIILTVLLDMTIKPMVSRSTTAQKQANSKNVRPFYVPSTPPSSAQTPTYYVPSTPTSAGPSYQTYEQGYQAIVQPDPSESEEVTDTAYAQQYEQPQASYPQLLPPPQQ